jgi:hypothetical protein
VSIKSSEWTSFGKGKVGRFDRHSSGWEIHHCGHPTATWPWYAISPTGVHVCSESGHGWRTLAQAHEHVEQAVAGARKVSYQHKSTVRKDGQIYGRLVPTCYACDAAATGRAIPGGSPNGPDAPACNRHRWAELGDSPCRRTPATAEVGDVR